MQATLGEEICQEGNFLLFDYGILSTTNRIFPAGEG
jgi:hypothetical protein